MPKPTLPQFTDEMLVPQPARGWGVRSKLRHFAIVTWLIDADILKQHLHPRFVPLMFRRKDGSRQALISAVPFADADFRFARFPHARFNFGQTNYRAYVIDSETGERGAWFFGTTIGSWVSSFPRHLWKLPWHRGDIRFDCEYDTERQRYTKYSMHTESSWAPASLTLTDSGLSPIKALPGFPDLESSMVILTHPLTGWYRRRDNKIGTYSVWHPQLQPTVGSCDIAHFPLFSRLGFFPSWEGIKVHSVLMQHEIDFTIHLPPHIVESTKD